MYLAWRLIQFFSRRIPPRSNSRQARQSYPFDNIKDADYEEIKPDSPEDKTEK
jgi:hypothetical protein